MSVPVNSLHPSINGVVPSIVHTTPEEKIAAVFNKNIEDYNLYINTILNNPQLLDAVKAMIRSGDDFLMAAAEEKVWKKWYLELIEQITEENEITWSVSTILDYNALRNEIDEETAGQDAQNDSERHPQSIGFTESVSMALWTNWPNTNVTQDIEMTYGHEEKTEEVSADSLAQDLINALDQIEKELDSNEPNSTTTFEQIETTAKELDRIGAKMIKRSWNEDSNIPQLSHKVWENPKLTSLLDAISAARKDDSKSRIDAIKENSSAIYSFIKAKDQDAVKKIAEWLVMTSEELELTFEKAIQREKQNVEARTRAELAEKESENNELRRAEEAFKKPESKRLDPEIDRIDEENMSKNKSHKTQEEIDLEKKQQAWNRAREDGTFEEKILNKAAYILEILDGKDFEKKARMFLVTGFRESELREVIWNSIEKNEIDPQAVSRNFQTIMEGNEVEELQVNEFWYILEESTDKNGITTLSILRDSDKCQQVEVATELLDEETRRTALRFLLNELRIKYFKNLTFEKSSREHGIKFDGEEFSCSKTSLGKTVGKVWPRNITEITYSFSGEIGWECVESKNTTWRRKKVKEILKMRQGRLMKDIEKLSYVEEVNEDIESEEENLFEYKWYSFKLNTSKKRSGNMIERYKHEIIWPIWFESNSLKAKFPSSTLRKNLSDKIRNWCAEEILKEFWLLEEKIVKKENKTQKEIPEEQETRRVESFDLWNWEKQYLFSLDYMHPYERVKPRFGSRKNAKSYEISVTSTINWERKHFIAELTNQDDISKFSPRRLKKLAKKFEKNYAWVNNNS